MTRTICRLALAVGLGLTGIVWAQVPSLRTVYVSIADHDAPLPGLQASDVEVTEDGRARPVVSLAPATEPMTVALVIDDHGLGLPEARQAASEFVESMPADASIGLFSTRFVEWTVTGYTRERQALRDGIQRLMPMVGGHDLEGLIRHLADDFRTRGVRRPVVVLVTIGEGGGSLAPNWDRVVDQVRRSGATFYAVAVRETHPRDMLIIDTSTEVSGGRVESSMTNAGVIPALQRIADTLLGQYALTYEASPASERGARLRVNVNRPDVKVRAPQRVY
jgi:hypothetical protein